MIGRNLRMVWKFLGTMGKFPQIIWKSRFLAKTVLKRQKKEFWGVPKVGLYKKSHRAEDCGVTP